VPYRAILEALEAGRFVPIFTPETLEELHYMLAESRDVAKRFNVDVKLVGYFINAISAADVGAVMIEIQDPPFVSSDPDDDYFIEAAVESRQRVRTVIRIRRPSRRSIRTSCCAFATSIATHTGVFEATLNLFISRCLRWKCVRYTSVLSGGNDPVSNVPWLGIHQRKTARVERKHRRRVAFHRTRQAEPECRR